MSIISTVISYIVNELNPLVLMDILTILFLFVMLMNELAKEVNSRSKR